MRFILILYYILSLTSVFAQDEKTVTLTVSGQGKTQDEARQMALRSAIEQAFGTFISSKTEIFNDNLIKDEIVSVSNGNIQKFDPISDVQMDDGEFVSTLKATVSVTKLTSFCESKGVEVEYTGALFAANIIQQKLNEKNEAIAIQHMTREYPGDWVIESMHYNLQTLSKCEGITKPEVLDTTPRPGMMP